MGERITFGGYQGPNSVHTRAVQKLAEGLTQSTDGGVEISFRPNITEDGHKAALLLDMVESGDLDGCYFSSSYLTKLVPALALFDQHFVVPDRAHAYQLLDGALGRQLAQEVAAKTNYVVMGYWDNGLRHISTVRTPLTDPKMCNGLRLRTLASEDHRRVFGALGFDPMVVDAGELPEAVKSGRVDAQENPLTNIYNFDLHKTHRTITLTGHLLGVAVVLFNARKVASWSPQTRAAVADAVDQATAAQRQFAQADDAACTDAMVKDGVRFVTLTPAQRDQFAAATRKEVDAMRVGLSPALIEMFENDLAIRPEGPQ